MLSERHRIDEVARSFERKLCHLSGRPTPSSMGLVPNSDDNSGTSNLPVTMEPMFGIDHALAPTSEITTKTHKIAPPISVRASTSIPAVPRQLGSASSSAPLMPVSPNTHSPIFQGAQNVYLHHPTITMVNNIQHASASNADANEQLRIDDFEEGMTEKAKARDRAEFTTPPEVIRTDSVGYEKAMTTKATLHRDGKVIVKTSTNCHDMFHGLRGRVLIVVRDVNGDAIGVTDKMCCTTRGGLLDFLTPSFGDDSFFLEFPREVASLAVSLDIWQADDASVGDVLSRILEKAQDTSITIAHFM